jgi:glycosyltransferase involved in cell wall biosynthesis
LSEPADGHAAEGSAGTGERAQGSAGSRERAVRETSARAETAYTICVINFNGMKVIGPTLEALLRIPDPGLHIMVLDNGSTDGSREWVAEKYPQLDLHHTASDGNLPRVRNYALQNAPTRYMMLCDNDLILAPDCPARLLETMTAGHDVLAVTPRMLYTETPEIIHNDVGRVHYLAVSGRSERGMSVQQVPPDSTPQETVPGGIAMIDRELAGRIGLFDDVYPFGWGCDAEFYTRGTIAGMKSLHRADALSYHPVPAHGFGRAAGQIHNRYRFILTQYAGRTLLLLAPVLLPFELALTGLFVLKGLTGVQLRAIGKIWRGRKEVRATRRAIQGLRRASDTAYLDASGFSGGGPLASGPVRAVAGVANAILRGYWALVRPLL